MDSARNERWSAETHNYQLLTYDPGKRRKIHVIHRRSLEHEPHRQFVGEVEDYQGGVARIAGWLFTVDRDKGGFVRRPDLRIRLISIIAGDAFVKVIPNAVNLESISYHQEEKVIRVTDGSDWHLDNVKWPGFRCIRILHQGFA